MTVDLGTVGIKTWAWRVITLACPTCGQSYSYRTRSCCGTPVLNIDEENVRLKATGRGFYRIDRTRNSGLMWTGASGDERKYPVPKGWNKPTGV